jgi:NitT/TauT family transport system substrate-binding protein
MTTPHAAAEIPRHAGRSRGRPGACLAIGAVWLGAVITLAPASATETLSVGKAGQNVFAFALLDVGMRAGVFAKYGLDLQVSELASGARLQQALAAGSVDIGFGGGTDFVAVFKGAPVRAVAALAGPPFDFGITVRADGPIRAVADLKGAKVGVTTLNSLTAWLTGELARQQGWGSDGITRIAVGSNATSIALLRTREIDGFTADLGNALQVEKLNGGRVLLQFGDVVKDFYTFVIFAHVALIKDRPDALRTFLKAWFETLQFVRANKAFSVGVITEVLGRDPELVARLYDQLASTYSNDGRFEAGRMKGLARALKEQYAMDESALTGLYTEQFLPSQ